MTGASGQLGTAIAGALAERGASLVLVDLREPALATVEDQLAGADVLSLAEDLTSDGAPQRVVARALEAFGRVDVLVNNAAVEGPIGPVEAIPEADVRKVFEVNVFGLLRMTTALLSHLTDRGTGRIVNIASGAGLAGTGFMAAYSSSKHAVVGLTRSIAQEVAGRGVTVNAVCPGCVDSPMMDRIESRLGELQGRPVSFTSAIPMGRYSKPAEVADLVAYLALDAPPYITGAALVIDGGLRA
ncbi:MAG: SDR family NAD(P)-dependent oxidoreductase [Candidatus Limnocylindrales bacterium]